MPRGGLPRQHVFPARFLQLAQDLGLPGLVDIYRHLPLCDLLFVLAGRSDGVGKQQAGDHHKHAAQRARCAGKQGGLVANLPQPAYSGNAK